MPTATTSSGRDDLGPRALRDVHGADRRATHGRASRARNPTSPPTSPRSSSTRRTGRSTTPPRSRSAGGRSSSGISAAATPTTTSSSPCRGPGVLFAGDLIENGNVPFFGDGYPLDWPATAAAIVPLVGDGVVVPGHGDHAGRDFAERQAGLALHGAGRHLARRVARARLTLDDAVAAHPFDEHPPEHARGPLGAPSRRRGASSASRSGRSSDRGRRRPRCRRAPRRA